MSSNGVGWLGDADALGSTLEYRRGFAVGTVDASGHVAMRAVFVPQRSQAAQRALDAGRRRIVRNRLAAQPGPMRVPSRIRPDAYVLTHRSTVQRDAWQATYFDADGPAGDTTSADFAALLKNADECYLCEWREAVRR